MALKTLRDVSEQPRGIMVYANFMHRVGLLKLRPETWQQVFVSELHSLPGN